MKKLKLDFQQRNIDNILTRDQLKKVYGGSDSGSGTTGNCPCGSQCIVSDGIGNSPIYGTCTPVLSPDGPLDSCVCTGG